MRNGRLKEKKEKISEGGVKKCKNRNVGSGEKDANAKWERER